MKFKNFVNELNESNEKQSLLAKQLGLTYLGWGNYADKSKRLYVYNKDKHKFIMNSDSKEDNDHSYKILKKDLKSRDGVPKGPKTDKKTDYSKVLNLEDIKKMYDGSEEELKKILKDKNEGAEIEFLYAEIQASKFNKDYYVYLDAHGKWRCDDAAYWKDKKPSGASHITLIKP